MKVEAIAIQKLDHVSILAHKPESVVEFYEEFLGFKLVSKREVEKMHMNIYDLKARDEHIEIIQPTSQDIRMSDGIKHVAFLSDNIREDFESFKEKGAKLLHKEVQKQENVSFFFARSPSGEFVEIIQYL